MTSNDPPTAPKAEPAIAVPALLDDLDVHNTRDGVAAPESDLRASGGGSW